MKQKQVLIKLAQVNQAARHVLKTRMQKQAEIDPRIAALLGALLGGGLGYGLNSDKKSRLWTAILGSGLGGLAGYGVNNLFKTKPNIKITENKDRKTKDPRILTYEDASEEQRKAFEMKPGDKMYVSTGLSGKGFERLQNATLDTTQSLPPKADTIRYSGIDPKYQYIIELANTLNNSPNNIARGDVSIRTAGPRNKEVKNLYQIARDASAGKLSQDEINKALAPWYEAYHGLNSDPWGEDFSNMAISAYSMKPFDSSTAANVLSGLVSGVPVYPVEGVRRSSDTIPEGIILDWVKRTRPITYEGRHTGEDSSFGNPREYRYSFRER